MFLVTMLFFEIIKKNYYFLRSPFFWKPAAEFLLNLFHSFSKMSWKSFNLNFCFFYGSSDCTISNRVNILFITISYICVVVDYSHEYGLVAGWGTEGISRNTCQDSRDTFQDLQDAVVQVLSRRQCAAAKYSDFYKKVKPRILCGAEVGTDSCQVW